MFRSGRHLFSSESVTEGHPDKIADQISDAILDGILAQDPVGRVACESFVTTGLAFVAGEISTSCYVDVPRIVRETIRDIGYTEARFGFDHETSAVMTSINEQSADIAMGVDPGGAGDQGMMFGYACRETPELMPAPIMLAHAICRQLAVARRTGLVPDLRPDGKSQVTVEYDGPRPVRVHTIVVAAQHNPDLSESDLRDAIVRHVITPAIPPAWLDTRTTIHVNPTGRFVIGGPQGDTGLTGRKIIVDTYGGAAPHGGGAFSGKDPTKVDRSASYMARFIAKNCVAAGLADRLLVQLAYAIGVADPVSIMLDTYGTGRVSEDRLEELVRAHFELTPRGIIRDLDLRRPIFRTTAAYGHFGRTEPSFSWEATDRADALRADAGI
jgi:S-adenosylmethionine synthetase